MGESLTITELISGVVAEMGRLKYAPLSIREFRYTCSDFVKYLSERDDTDIFTEEIGAEYLKDKLGFPFENTRPLNSMEANRVRCIRRIGEYNAHKTISTSRKLRTKYDDSWAGTDDIIIKAYLKAVQTADNSDATKQLRTHHVRLFYEFLNKRNINGVRELSPQIISEYALSLSIMSPVYTKHLLATLRYYLRFLHKNNLSTQDWSVGIPKVSVPANLNIPALWEKSDVERLLKSIDRGSPSGKRDYAVILLVVQLGLRIHDVAGLLLCNLKWERKELDFVQHKTSNRMTQRLLDDVGWAIIDYIRYGRPDVTEPYVFLSANAPYTKLSPTAIGNILELRMRRCGIQKTPGMASGMHSLRHALARRLLESGTTLQGVADIMGHTKYSSTLTYLQSDIDGLRKCALSLEEAGHYA